MKISLFCLSLLLIPFANAKLRVGFYNTTCPQAEKIVRLEVSKLFNIDRSVTAALLRLNFHDCFVGGCDASIFIDSTPKNQSEKDAPANGSVRGFEIIDQIKRKLEAACPKTVSCADVLILATKESVGLSGGPKYTVPTGRRDGLISDPKKVDLPSPFESLSKALKYFKRKGFNTTEAVALMGGHSVGNAACSSFLMRLTSNNGKPDRTMDPSLALKLAKICATQKLLSNPKVFLDQNTSFVMDNEFYNQVEKKRGILQIDQELAFNNATAPIVSSFANNAKQFKKSFAKVMVKLATFDVIVGNKGEIRRNCRQFNSASS